mmetsp:Transcript_24286/g.60358  ORF Transcript_24286/g.60358 Transcript_24286/m.60358 type:complete len:259 (-) Transcript_24286:108-884(-)
MSPTRYKDPVTRTCTRLPLLSRRSSAASNRTRATACRRHGTTTAAAAPAADSNEPPAPATAAAGSAAAATAAAAVAVVAAAVVVPITSPWPVPLPPSPAPAPAPTPPPAPQPAPPSTACEVVHPVCFLASSAQVRARPACHTVFSMGPAKGTRPLLELSEGAKIAGCSSGALCSARTCAKGVSSVLGSRSSMQLKRSIRRGGDIDADVGGGGGVTAINAKDEDEDADAGAAATASFAVAAQNHSAHCRMLSSVCAPSR